MNVIFDLDGTLIDARQRLHGLFTQLAPQAGLSLDAYWACKRDKRSHADILAQDLGWDASAIVRFQQDWLALIESPDCLALDSVLPGVPAMLNRLARDTDLHLCTARQSASAALAQLQRLGLHRHFRQVLVTGGPAGRQHSKEALIRARVDGLAPGDWLIGDTGHDIRTARSLGMRSCAVGNGFMSPQRLRPYGPDRLIDSAADFTLTADDWRLAAQAAAESDPVAH